MDKDKLPVVIALLVLAMGLLGFAIKRSQGPQLETPAAPPAPTGTTPEPGLGPGATGVQTK